MLALPTAHRGHLVYHILLNSQCGFCTIGDCCVQFERFSGDDFRRIIKINDQISL